MVCFCCPYLPLPLQYDEYDNAAHCMMAHSTVAWEHVTFKDVVIKVSNVDVYYKAIRFYLQVRGLPWWWTLLRWPSTWLATVTVMMLQYGGLLPFVALSST